MPGDDDKKKTPKQSLAFNFLNLKYENIGQGNFTGKFWIDWFEKFFIICPRTIFDYWLLLSQGREAF